MSESIIKTRVGQTAVWQIDGIIHFHTGLQIDADGAPNAYHPPTDAHPRSGRPPGLDDLRNAGHEGRWWGVATHDGTPDSRPIVQGPDDPYPGFYVSTTSLSDPTRPTHDPGRYVDSSKVPYISLPSAAEPGAPPFARQLGLHLGDLAAVFYGKAWSAAIYADVGPIGKIGEGSIALAAALQIFHGVNVGHDKDDVYYLVFPGSRATPAWPREPDDILIKVQKRLSLWGGIDRMRAIYPNLR